MMRFEMRRDPEDFFRRGDDEEPRGVSPAFVVIVVVVAFVAILLGTMWSVR